MPMVEDQRADQVGDGPLCDLRSPCLWAAIQSLENDPLASPQVAAARALVRDLATANGALELRIARIAAWIKTQDLSQLGYPTWSAFVRAKVEFKPSWLGELVKLAQSKLDLVKKAVSKQLIPMSVAIRAPGHITTEEQRAWLADAVAGDALQRVDADELADRRNLDVVIGGDAEKVKRARSLAALCLGVEGPNRVLDHAIIEWWMDGVPGPTILREARKPRPTPDLAPPSWCDEPDPATALLGPWEQPTDLHHGLQLLDAAQHLRRERVAALGLLLDEVRSVHDCLDWGHHSFDDYVHDELQMSVRTAQRYRKLGNCLRAFCDLRAAVTDGLDLDRAHAAGRLVDTDNLLRAWLGVVPGLPRAEARLLDERSRDLNLTGLRKTYRNLQLRAPDLVARALTATENGNGLGTTDPTRIKVARPPDPPDVREARAQSYLWVHPQLLEASTWLLSTVKIPPETGFRRILDVQHHTCQNPECHRRWITNHAHHDQERSKGGSDDPLVNGRTLCKSCHLRLRHSGKLAIVKLDDVVVYLYPGRAVVVG